jgi:EmrB/QacA subfamily drug resistance transporter
MTALAGRRKMNPKVSVGVVYVTAMFMAIMDVTIVNVALPTLGRDFHVRSTSVDAVVVSFLVSLAVFIPASGWVADRFGDKRVLLTAITVFTGASALCGLAQSLPELVGFRILQGVGGGMLTPVGMSMLYRTYAPHERIRASRILVVPTAFAPALGPVIGGLFVTELSWRWVFYVNVPIGFFAVTFGALFLDEHRQPKVGSFDWVGFLLAGAGFASLMYAVSEGPSLGWTAPRIVATGIAGVVLLVALVLVELRVTSPMLNLRLMKDRLFRTTNIVMFLGLAGFLGSLYLVALFYQYGLGHTALASGLATFPEAVGVMVGSQVSTRLYPRLGPRRIMAAGLTAVAVILACMSRVGAGPDTLWIMRGLIFCLGYSMSHVFVPGGAAAFASISKTETAHASALFNSGRQLGSALGVAVLTTVLAAVGPFHLVGHILVPHLAAYHAAFLTAAAIALVAGGVALAIRDSDAAPSMRRIADVGGADAAVPSTVTS